jgi:TolB-like protein/Flp pilus assembly protein TadD
VTNARAFQITRVKVECCRDERFVKARRVNPKNFFAELKRRHVYRVAVAYAVLGWLLIQVATQVFPFFEIPNWGVRLIVLFIVIGFPIALVIAWAFELTPEGLKRTELADELPKKSSRNRVWLYVVVIAGAISVSLFFFGRYTATSKQSGLTEVPAKSIAVLPFENLSGNPENAYFTDGIQEEILMRLAKIADLKVISRTSTVRYKSSPDNLREIATQLGVANVLEGSVQRTADRVHVNVQLIKAATDAHLWAEAYDRKLTDIFAVESEVAKTIAETLQAKLTGAERQQLAKPPTENLKAFQYYMQGRSYAQRSTREDLLTAIHYYEKAIDEDRNYALAYAGLADAYGTLGVRGYIAPIEGRRKEEEAARKALALDENLAEAHSALGHAYAVFAPSNFSLGDRELQRAIELSPSLAVAHFYLGISLVRQGRLDEALEELLKARELDPLSSTIARNAVLPYYFKRDYVRALERLRQANDLGPALSTTWEIGVYIQNRSFNEAFAELEKAKRERKSDPILIYSTGMVYAAQGKRAEALQIIKELEEMSGASLSEAHWVAKIYATLNEKDLAFSWLERGLATGAIGAFYKDDAVWDAIRSDPRFADLLRRMGIP